LAGFLGGYTQKTYRVFLGMYGTWLSEPWWKQGQCIEMELSGWNAVCVVWTQRRES